MRKPTIQDVDALRNEIACDFKSAGDLLSAENYEGTILLHQSMLKKLESLPVDKASKKVKAGIYCSMGFVYYYQQTPDYKTGEENLKLSLLVYQELRRECEGEELQEIEQEIQKIQGMMQGLTTSVADQNNGPESFPVKENDLAEPEVLDGEEWGVSLSAVPQEAAAPAASEADLIRILADRLSNPAATKGDIEKLVADYRLAVHAPEDSGSYASVYFSHLKHQNQPILWLRKGNQLFSEGRNIEGELTREHDRVFRSMALSSLKLKTLNRRLKRAGKPDGLVSSGTGRIVILDLEAVGDTFGELTNVNDTSKYVALYQLPRRAVEGLSYFCHYGNNNAVEPSKLQKKLRQIYFNNQLVDMGLPVERKRKATQQQQQSQPAVPMIQQQPQPPAAPASTSEPGRFHNNGLARALKKYIVEELINLDSFFERENARCTCNFRTEDNSKGSIKSLEKPSRFSATNNKKFSSNSEAAITK